jgi:hypothetical protein
MLEHTFIHITGIGPKTEQAIWGRGILTWEQFLNRRATVLSPGRDGAICRELAASLENRDDLRFFLDRLPFSDHWRTYETFKDRAVFLDIETNGGYQGLEEITLIGLFDGSRVRTFISGRDLNDFEEAIQAYDLVITYNGTGFDLPCLKRYFRHLTLPPGHIDLRFLLKKIGLRGGLKAIEKKVGLIREAEVDGLDGFDAVRLWKAYEWGDESALRRLILYNTADIVNLQPLMELALQELKTRLLPIFNS